MRHFLFILLILAGWTAGAQEGASSLADWYVSPSVGMRFFGGGEPARLATGAGLAGGRDFSEFWSAEAGVAWDPWAEGEHASGGQIFSAYADVLRHLDSYERFDPYLALGLGVSRAEQDLYAGGEHPFAAGPRAGLGFFYNLSDRWAFRADVRACLDIDEACGMGYTVSAGLVYRLGGTGLTPETWKQPEN